MIGDNAGSDTRSYTPIEHSQAATLLAGKDVAFIWVNTANMQRLYDAATHNRKRYVLTTGVPMNIEYRKGDRIFVSPGDGTFAPCGHFTVKEIQDKLTVMMNGN